MPKASEIKHMNKIDVCQSAKDLHRNLEIIEQEIQMRDIDKNQLLKKVRECKTAAKSIWGNLK